VDNPPSTKSKRKKLLELEDELMDSCLKKSRRPEKKLQQMNYGQSVLVNS
jgi:hypothetical protein